MPQSQKATITASRFHQLGQLGRQFLRYGAAPTSPAALDRDLKNRSAFAVTLLPSTEAAKRVFKDFGQLPWIS